MFSILSFTANAQDGWKYIKKAESKIAHGRYTNAENLLKKADTMNYGFCALAYWDAREEITLNRVKIADAQSDTMFSIDLLCDTTRNLFFSDEILFEHIFVYQNKESVREELKSALLIYKSADFMELYFPVLFSFRETPVILRGREISDLFYTLQSNEDTLVKELLIDEFLASDYAGGILSL